MLVLSRRPGEQIRIGQDITITVIRSRGNRVRLGVQAPEQFRIRRADAAFEAVRHSRRDHGHEDH